MVGLGRVGWGGVGYGKCRVGGVGVGLGRVGWGIGRGMVGG